MIVVYFLDGDCVYPVDKRGSICHSGDVYRIDTLNEGETMFHTARETSEQTTARLLRAWDKQRPVTITYTKADGTETVRSIEIYDVTTSKAGDVLIKAMDRQSGESRTWRLDRISAYTVHSGQYVVPRETDTTVRPLAAQPVALTPLSVAPAAVRIQQLADTLAA